MPSGGAGSLSDHLWIRKETPRIIFMPMYSLIFMVMTLSHWGYIELYFMLAILENREVCNNLSKFSNTKCSNIIFKVIFCKAWSTLKKQTLYPWKRGEAPPPPSVRALLGAGALQQVVCERVPAPTRPWELSAPGQSTHLPASLVPGCFKPAD